MISFDTPLALLLAIPLVGLAVLFWSNGFVNLSRRRAQVALAVRVAMLGAMVLGLAGLAFNLGQSRQATVLVADVSASDAQAETQIQNFINQAARQRPSADREGVVVVGRDARVEQPVSNLSSFNGFQTQVDRNYTNLADGLLLGNAILPNGYRHRVTLLTDGQQNLGDALSAARLLRSLGVTVDVWPIHVASGPEVLVDSVTMPSQLRTKEHFTVDVAVRSNVATTMDLTVFRDSALVVSRRETVRVGENNYCFAQAPLSPGFHGYTVHIDPLRDTQPENNSGSAFTVVAGPPKVLVISPSRAQAANVMDSLKTTGIQGVFQFPYEVIPTLSYLQRYAAVVLIDTPVDAMDPQIVSDFVPYVRDLGRGLVVIGGTETYGMGGYGQTGLEQALPVNMNLPKRRDLPSAAVVLDIESLEANTDINISKEAGKGVVSLLTEQDQVAVNDENGGSFPVPLQYATNKQAIDNSINNMQPGDPMSYAQDLQDSFNILKTSHASVKHIILLGDGDAEDPGYEALAKKIRAGGVTISTVATNGQGYADFQTMEDIAKWGGGRYYNANNTNAIPSIFLREARTVARSGIILGKFFPQELSANPMLRDLSGVTDLTGYVATTPKPTGEMILVSKKLDPVLAGWQFGLGRSVAWTSDASGQWTHDWLLAPGANKFWADLVSWTLPAANGGQLFVNTGASQGQGTISVNTPNSVGPNPVVTAHVLGPGLGSTSSVQLQPTAPGHYQGAFDANAPGAYFVSTVARGGGHAEVGEAGIDIPYSAEYRTSGTNMSFIRELARAGGGTVISKSSSVWANNLQSVSARQPLSIWLWLLALLLLPIDIGVRRLIVNRQDLEAIWRALTGFRQPAPVLEPAVASLGAVRLQRGSGLGSIGRRATGISGAGSTTSNPAQGAAAAVSALRINRTGKSSKPRPAGGASSTAKSPPDTSQDEGSLAGSLLAAKRKRR